jgi:dihydropteroate synthase
MSWEVQGAEILLDRPRVLGILNVTPDSFSDGSKWIEPSVAIDRALEMIDEGADLIDVGAESTRPGAASITAEEEWRRLEPVLQPLAQRGVTLSIDTTKREVARRALDLGAAAINDVSGLVADPEIASDCAAAGAGLILMHMRGDPRTMQDDLEYSDVVTEIADFLTEQARIAEQAGCRNCQIVIDPGIGFGKSAAGNLEILGRIEELADRSYPVLVGPSRKSFIGQTLGLPIQERVEATIAACLAAYAGGATLFRVHDVAPARRALDMACAIRNAAAEGHRNAHMDDGG